MAGCFKRGRRRRGDRQAQLSMRGAVEQASVLVQVQGFLPNAGFLICPALGAGLQARVEVSKQAMTGLFASP